MDELQRDIAHNLRKIRLLRGLSLDQTAGRTGVSKSMLAQIEKEKSNPTISTLWKIATGLQVSFSTFMKKEETAIRQVPFNGLKPVIDDQNHYLVYALFPFDPEKNFEIYLVRLKAHSVHHSEQHAGDEYLLISSGTIHLSIHEKSYTLQCGDAFNFSANGPHQYENTDDEEVVFFDIIYYSE